MTLGTVPGDTWLPRIPPSLVPRNPQGDLKGAAAASLFAGIRRSSRWSLLEDSGETSFSNRNEPFRFEEEEPGESCRYSAKSRIPAIHPCDDAVPFGGFFRLFLCRSKKEARRRRRDMAANSRDKRRIRRKAGGSSAAAGITSQSSGFRETPDASSPFWGACFARCGGDGNRTREFRLRATPFLSAEKWGKDAPGGPFHKGPPGPLLTAKGLRPIGSPAGFYERRRTKDERRRTGVRTGVTDCHSRGWAPASQ